MIIKLIVKNLPTKKISGLVDFTNELHQNLMNTFSNLTKLFIIHPQKMNKGSLTYEASITFTSNPAKDSTAKENYKPILFMNIDLKILNKIIAQQS